MNVSDTAAEVEPDSVERWLVELCAELGVPVELAACRALLLDVARDAAHHVERPAAPLTTFLVGYAAGLAAGRGENSATAIAQSAAAVTTLIRRQSVRPHQ